MQDVKTPNSATIRGHVDQMGQGHFGFDSSEVQKSLGLGDGALTMVGQGQFTKQGPSQPQLEDETPEQKETRLKDLKEKEDEQKAKALAKKKAKPFE